MTISNLSLWRAEKMTIRSPPSRGGVPRGAGSLRTHTRGRDCRGLPRGAPGGVHRNEDMPLSNGSTKLGQEDEKRTRDSSIAAMVRNPRMCERLRTATSLYHRNGRDLSWPATSARSAQGLQAGTQATRSLVCAARRTPPVRLMAAAPFLDEGAKVYRVPVTSRSGPR